MQADCWVVEEDDGTLTFRIVWDGVAYGFRTTRERWDTYKIQMAITIRELGA